jgi:hypothetical protein
MSTATCGMQMEYEIPDVAPLIRATLAAVSLYIFNGRSHRPFPSFAVRRNWNPAFRITTVLPMRILLLRPATHLHLTLMMLRLKFCC